MNALNKLVPAPTSVPSYPEPRPNSWPPSPPRQRAHRAADCKGPGVPPAGCGKPGPGHQAVQRAGGPGVPPAGCGKSGPEQQLMMRTGGPGVPPAGCGKSGPEQVQASRGGGPGVPPPCARGLPPPASSSERRAALQNLHSLPDPTGFFSVDLAAKLRAKPAAERHMFPTDEEVVAAVAEYQRFFVLMCLRNNEDLVPSRAQDEVWHVHMMSPKAYVADCLAYAGEVIDHNAGFGSTPETAPLLDIAFGNTRLAWEEIFGEPHPAGQGETCTGNARCAGVSAAK
jgi:hypothetical protein